MPCSVTTCDEEADIAVQWANDDTGVISIDGYCESHYELLRVAVREERGVEIPPIEAVLELTMILAN